jgi:hypothetical protein
MNADSERRYREQFTRGWGCHYAFGIILHNPELQEKSFWQNCALSEGIQADCVGQLRFAYSPSDNKIVDHSRPRGENSTWPTST